MPNVNLSFSRKNSPHPFLKNEEGNWANIMHTHHHHPTPPPPLRSEFHQSQPILRRISQTNTLLAFHSFFATTLLKNEAIFMIYDVIHQNLNLQHYMNNRLLDSAVDPDSACVFNFSNKVQKRVYVWQAKWVREGQNWHFHKRRNSAEGLALVFSRACVSLSLSIWSRNLVCPFAFRFSGASVSRKPSTPFFVSLFSHTLLKEANVFTFLLRGLINHNWDVNLTIELSSSQVVRSMASISST